MKDLKLKCATEPSKDELSTELDLEGDRASMYIKDDGMLALFELDAAGCVELATWLNAAARELDPGAFEPGPIKVVPARFEPTPLFQLYLAYISKGHKKEVAHSLAKDALAYIDPNAG